ncbi:MAG: hypothetical protein CL454_00535 [Acidimicrobiaceae bacterium]|nr:hypothetical protein [Acidimicrobiaceae bacterium]
MQAPPSPRGNSKGNPEQHVQRAEHTSSDEDAPTHKEDSEHYATNYAACMAYVQLLLHKVWKRVRDGGEEQPERLEAETGAPGVVQKWWTHFWNNGASEISPGLFVGSAADAACAPNLHSAGISLVVNATADIPNFFEGQRGAPEYVRVPMADVPDATFRTHLQETKAALAKIKEVRDKGGQVLVHCLMGASRSVAVACLALMEETGWSAERAYATTQAKRCPARINVSFMKDLETASEWLE